MRGVPAETRAARKRRGRGKSMTQPSLGLDLRVRVSFPRLVVPQPGLAPGSEDPIKLSVKLLKEGADPEDVSSPLTWQEFEKLVEVTLREHGFRTTRHVVFKHQGARREIDLLGAREDMLLCIDCKHWDYGCSPSRIRSAVNAQRERVRALSREPRALACMFEKRPGGFLLPVLVAFRTTQTLHVDGTPVVSIIRLGDFLRGVSMFADGLVFEKFARPVLTLDEVKQYGSSTATRQLVLPLTRV